MLTGILKRLKHLETSCTVHEPPDFEKWMKQWEKMQPIERSITVLNAENLEDFFGKDSREYRYQKTIAGYLITMGVIDPEAPSLREEAAELWEDYAGN